MPTVTDCRDIPYPLGPDGVDVAGDLAALAGKVDDDLCSLFTTVGQKVNRGGDTMTGMLTLPAANPSLANHATRKAYVDAEVNTRLLTTGDSMTGGLNMTGHKVTNVQLPTQDGDAANMEYVDHRVKREGDTMTGDLVMHANPGATAGIRLSGDIPIQISLASNTPDQPCIILRRGTSADANGQRFIRFERGDPPGTFMAAIEITSASSVAIVNASDHRLKENEGPVQNPSGRVKQLGALAFQGRWIADEGAGQAWDMLYAHDIDAVAPYAVRGAMDAVDTEGNPAYQTVDYASLVPLVIAALSEAFDRIATLEGPA